MRLLPRGQLAINWKHPDAKNLILAFPCNQGGQVLPYALGRFRPTLTTNYGQADDHWIKTRVGWQMRFQGLTNQALLYNSSLNLANNGRICMSMWITPLALDATYSQDVFVCSHVGIGLRNDVRFVEVYSNTPIGPAYVIGQTYHVGIMLHAPGTAYMYINGQEYPFAPPNAAADQLRFGAFVGTNFPIGFAVSDVRVYDRPMPRATFQRAYYDPASLYIRAPLAIGRTALRRRGNFLPFLTYV